jgi:hypothetical protein
VAEIESDDGVRLVVRASSYRRIRLGMIDSKRVLPLHARDHYGCELTVEEAQELREALDAVIGEVLDG